MKGREPDLVELLTKLAKEMGNVSPVRIPRKQAISTLKEMCPPGKDARLIFESWEKDLRKPILLGNWSAYYSVYADAIVLEYVPDWGQIERAVDIRQSNLEKDLATQVSSLSDQAFARFLANLFSRVGWASDVRITKQSHDGGIDFQGYYVYHDRGRVPLFGQAKHWTAKAGSELMRTFIGSVVTRSKGRPCVGVYACTGGFTSEAETAIDDSPFKLWTYDLVSLVKLMIEWTVGVRKTPLGGSRIDGSFWGEIS